MKGKIIIYFPNGEKITISGADEYDYEELSRGRERTIGNNRTWINQDKISVIVFEPQE